MVEIAIMGLGIVGGGVVDVLTKNAEAVAAKVGEKVHIKYILDIKDLSAHPMADRVVTDINIILNDPQVTLVAELMGGSHPAYEYSLACLQSGKHVVTSNKEVVANYGDELMQQALENGVRYLFEASVGGGIPILNALTTVLGANEFIEILGILNGTTNYILTQMTEYGLNYDTVLKVAQEKGFAEADPTADVEGIDVANKLSILMALAFDKYVPPTEIPTIGITGVTMEAIEAAKKDNCKIKLIAKAKKTDKGIEYSVQPTKLSNDHPLATVSNEFNAVFVTGNAVGELMFYGKGAGALPTGSAVMGDVIEIAKRI